MARGWRRLVWSDLEGVLQAIDLPPALYNDVRLSPDGTRLVYTLGPSGAGEVWVYSFLRGTTTRLTFTGINATPIWSADGGSIIFAAADGARTLVLEANADGGREPVLVAAAEGRAELPVDADGTWVLIDLIGGGQGGRPHIARLPLRVVRRPRRSRVPGTPMAAPLSRMVDSSHISSSRAVARKSMSGSWPRPAAGGRCRPSGVKNRRGRAMARHCSTGPTAG